MFCSNCGKEIDDNAVVCPHCGIATGAQPQQPQYQQPQYQQPQYQQPQYQQYPYQPRTESNPIAIVGFVFSFLIALVGLICSIVGYNKAKNEGAPYKGLALAGIIISAINMGSAILLYVIVGAASCAAL